MNKKTLSPGRYASYFAVALALASWGWLITARGGMAYATVFKRVYLGSHRNELPRFPWTRASSRHRLKINQIPISLDYGVTASSPHQLERYYQRFLTGRHSPLLTSLLTFPGKKDADTIFVLSQAKLDNLKSGGTPSQLPPHIPVYPHARPFFSLERESSPGTFHIYETRHSSARVLSYYRTAFTSSGLEPVPGWENAHPDRKEHTLLYEKEGKICLLEIERDPQDGVTNIAILSLD